MRVVLVDDHARHRQGMALVLGLDERIVVVGEAADGAAAVACVRDLDPDVVLLDARMPGMGGVEACARIVEDFSRTQCVMLTMADDTDEIEAALAAGAKGYLFKSADSRDVIETVLRVANLRGPVGNPVPDGRTQGVITRPQPAAR